MVAPLPVLAAEDAQPEIPANRFVIPSGGGEYALSGKSFADMRFVNVIRQKFDFSCGSAALATLLTHSYDRPTTEMEALEAMYEVGDKDKIHKEGFSLLDMKNYLTSIGLKAEGFQESLDKLRKVGIPAIVLINRNGYMHFVVVKGVTDDKVLIGDPALGLQAYDRSVFEPMWNNILFVIMDDKQIARSHFNDRNLWAKRDPQFRLAEAAAGANDISGFTLATQPTPNYY